MNINNNDVIKKFYTGFANGNVSEMTDCYHDNIRFKDPVFGELKGTEAKAMWEMLLSRRTDSTKISFENIHSTQDEGSADWKAVYLYGKSKRKVINNIQAHFKFKDGKIIEHIDTFDLWKWTQQALGISGYILGWTPFMKNKIRKTVLQQLNSFIAKKTIN
jgi:ketosteroid isomerase-like protein